MTTILLSGGFILTMCEGAADPESLREGWVGVVDHRIAMVSYCEAEAEAFVERYAGCEVVDCRGTIIMPGLVNTHTHVSMTLMRNYAEDMELMEWLTSYIWRFEALQSDDDIEAGARLGVAEMLLSGCTSFVDMYWSESVVARVVEQLGGRALLTEAVLDGRVELFVEGMDRLREVCRGSRRVRCGVGPHAPYTCSPETLESVREYAERYDLPITIHLSETKEERSIIEERYGVSPVEYIDKSGLLTDRTIVAHAVYLEPSEIDHLAQRGCSVAHNAESNMKLASGVAPVVEMTRRGLRCTIATDGASSNNDLDMFGEMRTAALLQRVEARDATVMKSYEVLRMATVEGARAMGYDDLGEIREGALADIIVVDITKPHLRPRYNLFAALIYSAKSSDVRDVVVDGEFVVRGGELLRDDIESICDDAERRSFAIDARRRG